MERTPNVPLNESDYWESWNDDLGLPIGKVYDSRSYNERGGLSDNIYN